MKRAIIDQIILNSPPRKLFSQLRPSSCSFVIFLMVFGVLFPAHAFTLIIDPGHGGEDRGATQGTIKESEIVLQVALKLAEHFSQDPNTQVILTRPTDSALSLRNRVAVNESYQGDLFISLHVNSSIDKRAKGADFYIGNAPQTMEVVKSPNQPLVDAIVQNVKQTARLYQSQFLASDIFNTWKESQVTQPRSVRQGPFYVINKNKVPSLLVEFGFITNTKESLELIKEEKQAAIAKSLYLAIKNYQNRKTN